MATADTKTPMMRQYHRIKAAHRDAIVFFRLGDFYEMFYEDAEVASAVLEITLTARHRGTPSEAPMCGVPAHAAEGYIAKLLEAGHKVAIAEQVGDPATAKGAMERRVVRVLTPGTLVEEGLLPSRENNYLVAVSEGDAAVGVAALEVSTGEFVAAEFDGEDRRRRALEEIERWAPREICCPEGSAAAQWLRPAEADPTPPWVWSPLAPWVFDPERAEARLCEHFGVASLAGYDLDGCRLATAAAGAVLHYALETQRAPLQHLRGIRRYRDREVLQLDSTTRRTLELTESWRERRPEGSLLHVIDETVTSMGGRRLRQWLLRPLRSVPAIRARQELVAQLCRDPILRHDLRRALARVRDLERLTTRITLGRAGPRELAALRASLEALPAVREALEALQGDAAEELLRGLDPCPDVRERIAERLADEPPPAVSEGGVIREGFDPELDRLRRVRREAKGFIARLQEQERERTGIASLKVGYNKVFGYYIEVSKPNLPRVPAHYIRRQTLANAERYITPELKEFEETVLSAEERIGTLEERLFVELRQQVAAEAGRLHGAADAVAGLDALASLAEVAAQRGYACPEVDDGPVIEIRQGRHPVVEALNPGRRFVPNDAYLDDGGHRIQIVTGPNMGGKSTYLRQVALITVLAQIGSFVPAEQARIGIVDRIFTRVGAGDDVARGVSTFLVEMQEAANILHNATPCSLVILDEVGRGTSTFDGLALAWAVVEYLQHRPQVAARTLFATHYHELTALEGRLPSVRNLNVAARETGEGVVFLHRVEPGPADRSYGIQVARLAGLPEAVIERAREILEHLEAGRRWAPDRPPWAPAGGVPARQLALFRAREHPILERLRGLSVEKLTPLEALNLLAGWRRSLEAEDEER